MKIIQQGNSLSEDDLHIIDTELVTKMVKNRLLIEFDESPDIESLDFSGCQGFYHIKSLGNKLYQFWFEHKQDYDTFYDIMIAYKMTLTGSDK
jgi:hypothetical protein